MYSLKYMYLCMYTLLCYSLRCADVLSSVKFSFTEACSEGKCDLRVSGVTEGFSDITKICDHLKAFQTKIFFCLCAGLCLE